MKTKILLLFVAAMLASCSSDNITESTLPASNELTLKKVETYYPSKAVYDSITGGVFSTKEIQYFENGYIVADSIYNQVHELSYIREYTYHSNTTYEALYTPNHTAVNSTLYTYDNSGRIIEYLNTQYSQPQEGLKKKFAYNADGTATITYPDYVTNETPESYGSYTANADGIISFFSSPSHNQSLLYQNGNPVTHTETTQSSTYVRNMTFYDIPAPANRLKTATQINNITLAPRLAPKN